jgi:hypothetical protein
MKAPKPHYEWWSKLGAGPRYKLMKEYNCSPITEKCIKRMFKEKAETPMCCLHG